MRLGPAQYSSISSTVGQSKRTPYIENLLMRVSQMNNTLPSSGSNSGQWRETDRKVGQWGHATREFHEAVMKMRREGAAAGNHKVRYA